MSKGVMHLKNSREGKQKIAHNRKAGHHAAMAALGHRSKRRRLRSQMRAWRS